MENEDLIEDDPTIQPDDQLNADDTEQTTPPDDPAERAAFFEAKATKAEQATAELKLQTKRLEGRVKEESDSKNHWHGQAKRLEEQVTRPLPAREEKPPVEEEEELDLAQLALEKDGGKQLMRIINQKAEKIAERIAEKVAGRKIESTLSEVGQTYRVTNQFKELEDPKSEFAVRTFAVRAELEQDEMYQGMKPAALTELAATKVRAEFLEAGKKTRTAEDVRDKRLGRIGTPTGNGKPSGNKGAKVEVDPRLLARAESRGLTAKEAAEAYDPKGVVGWQPGQ